MIDESELPREPPIFLDWATADNAYSRLSYMSIPHRPALLPSQSIPWSDVVLDMQRLIVRACDRATRSCLARTCRANMRYIITLPGACRTRILIPMVVRWKNHAATRALRAFHDAGVLYSAPLLVGAHFTIGANFRIAWRQKWGKPCFRIGAVIEFTTYGDIAHVRYGLRRHRQCGRTHCARWDGPLFFSRFLASPLAGELSLPPHHPQLPWVTVKDFITDPGRFPL
jgi:hypothetical protein